MKVVASEKDSFSDTQNPKAVCNSLTVYEMHYLVTRVNLMQRIHIQLSEKRKSFFDFFLHFLDLYYNLTICQKKMNLRGDVFVEILARKDMVR